MRGKTLWIALGATALLGTAGCGQAVPPSVQAAAAPGVATGESYRVQQTGTAICNRRYRACLRALVRELGSQAIEICQERRDRCQDALGEGYFYRGGTRR